MVETAPETPDVDATADDDDAPPPRLLRVSDLVKAAAEGNFTDEVKFIAAMGACLDGSTVDMVLNKNDRAFVQIASKVYGQMDEQGTWNGEWDQEKRTFTPTDPAADPTYTLVKPLRDINIETLVFRRLKVRDLVGVYNGQRTGNVEISRGAAGQSHRRPRARAGSAPHWRLDGGPGRIAPFFARPYDGLTVVSILARAGIFAGETVLDLDYRFAVQFAEDAQAHQRAVNKEIEAARRPPPAPQRRQRYGPTPAP